MVKTSTRRQLLGVGLLLVWLGLMSSGVTAAIVEGLGPSAVAALKAPPEKLEGTVQQDIGAAWDRVAEKVLREVFNDAGAVIVAKVWLDRVEGKPFVQLYAMGRTADRKDRVVVEVFRGLGKEGVEQRYGRWFSPVELGGQSIKLEDFAGDRAALSTLTEDGSEALYWQKGDIFIDVRRPADARPLAQAVHEAAQKHGLYVFPETPEKREAPESQVRIAAGDLSIVCKDGDVCREKKTGLPLRVLPRPFSNIYSSTRDGTVAYANVPTFHPLYVFGMEGVDTTKQAGWYRVGKTVRGEPMGWMKAKDLLEWRQALIVSYTHHGSGEEARQRVLMFEDLEGLKKVVEAPDAARRAVQMYQKFRQKEVPEGIVSKEPESFVDITQKFYMMPVVASDVVNLSGEEARYLQVAAAVLGARGEDVVTKNEVLEELMKEQVPDAEARKLLGLDVVFVMDMTASMQPFMDRTKNALNGLAASFVQTFANDPELKERIRFGLVGYRDDAKAMPGLEFTSRNFTPELVDAAELARILEDEASATIVGSRDHPEEMFAGVKEALTNTEWGADTLKWIIVVGDASSHPVEHAQNTTGLNAEELRRMAGDRQVHVGAIHLKDPNHRDDHAIAEKQLGLLTRVEGGRGEAAITPVDTSEEDGFEKAVEPLIKGVARLLDDYRKGRATGESGSGVAGKTMDAGEEGEPVEVLTVRADTPDPTRSATVLETGKEYVIEASGEFSAWGGEPHGVDPVWCYRPGNCDPMQLWEHLKVNGRGMAEIAGGKDALPYDFEHTYRVRYKGDGKPMEVWIEDAKRGSYADNTGGFTVRLFEASPKEQPGSVRMLKKLFDAALVEYLGRTANPPKDIVAWVLDRDLTDPGVRSLEVRVLLNREQLNDLLVALDTVLKALSNAELTQRQFFDALQAVAAQTEKDPERIASAQKLRDAGLLPAFVESLPYKSEILELSDARFAEMTAEQKSGLEQRLKAKLQQYRQVNEQVDGWVKLNEEDERTKMVYPLELDALP